MVGLALGLLIVAGASALLLTDMLGSRRLQVETKLEQDLRSAMDTLTRDLRRSGYWSNSSIKTNLTSNPHATLTLTESPPTIAFSYSRDSNDSLESNEQYAFRLDTASNGSGGIVLSLDANWLALLDTETMELDRLNSNIVRLQQDGSTALIEDPITLDHACPHGCATACQISVRAYRITLVGIAKADQSVRRTLTSTVRVRNDDVHGSCNP